MQKILFLFLVAYFSVSCEKAVNFPLNETEPKLVVDATIENGQPPLVILTRSLDYFTEISPQLLLNSFVRNAVVTVSNRNTTHTLKEYSRKIIGEYALYYYTIDSANLSNALMGEVNQEYLLRIMSDGKEYTATTTIPRITKKIDSVWWKQAPPNVDSNKVVAVVRATDPPGFGDYIRYFTKRNDEPFYPALNSVFDDLVIDGTTYEIQIEPGVDRNADRDEEEHFFNKGDTVVFKLSNIDKATYDFWRTMEYSYASVGNPFAVPVKVISNISNGALGYFGGYASQYRTLVIPE